MKITDEMIDAAIARTETINTQGFLYGSRHVLRDIEAERVVKTDVVIWEMTTDDYDAGHASMNEQAKRNYFRQAITAALSAMPAVRVKGLEWDRYGEAIGFDCKYCVYETGDGWNCVKYPNGRTYHRLADGVPEHAARAVAQADHEARVLSAIEPGGVGVDEDPNVTLRNAIRKAEAACKANDGYMPALSTLVRILADELADKYPDDINGGYAALRGDE